ncbi:MULTISPECIES: hypothetical protein [unclassified Pseudomonas]|uniref:hypothetical protein n=1 Tax=unclassified Pseudomonas TaxID=196821 RepID=UPI000C87CB5F|nr:MULTISPECIES: hypothetical protein [unclassified Pseudomonas]PMU87090.1 hypothetical protein C1Y30_23320 [Pseudomonas sp. GW704-F3]PMU91420.1 hypothetical protein C1Y28_23130 [Pseudomonas sp. GW704-F5]PMV01220.1 hypothetical protein C1Y29_20090 [Pseudomonas sp. MPBD4-3]PMV25764.1 hypothetical protein C1Y27_23715 [Pseudomonas sp. GW704-F2]
MTDKMREEFERTNGQDHRRQPPKGNNYIDPMAQADWESFQKGWRASRDALVVEVPDVHGVNWNIRQFVLDKCREAIRSQGLKVKS